MKRLARGLAVGFIVVYLGLHAVFFAGHTMGVTTGRGPSYFFTWDMYGGHSPWASRVHVVGEGEAGRLYRILPGPWAPFRPHGPAFRHDRDWQWNWRKHKIKSLAEAILRRTEHDPISAVYVVEERWLTKYNLPDRLWQQHYDVPKEPTHYFRVREVFAPFSDQRRLFAGLDSELLDAAPMELTVAQSPGKRE